MVSAKQDRIGFTFSNVAASPPIMTPSLPSSASFGVRASGASQKTIPRGASSSASARVSVGSEVDVSITIAPFFAPHATPSLPRIRASFDEILDRRAVLVAENRKPIALLDEVLRHTVTHEADADKTDLFLGHR